MAVYNDLCKATLLSCVLLGPIAPGASASDVFSHETWGSVLQEFVNDQGLVNYEGLAEDRAQFDEYVRRVERISPELHPDLFATDDDALAYYLNAYNALVFKGVLDRGPEDESVWKGLVSGYNFFVKMKIVLGGEQTSLKKLEDDVVRARFEDPRVHAALNCASLSCPRLPREPFEPATLDEQLEAAMAEFVNEARNCTVDRDKKTVSLSKIFDWFSADFLDYERRQGNEDPELVDYVNRYRRPGDQIPRTYDVRFYRYDKRINKQ